MHVVAVVGEEVAGAAVDPAAFHEQHLVPSSPPQAISPTA
jgi:hypothetical protein